MRSRPDTHLRPGLLLALALGACVGNPDDDVATGTASAAITANGPTLYTARLNDSPVRGDPGDVLLLPGAGFSLSGSAVVYQLVTNPGVAPTPPAIMPTQQTAALGAIAPLSVDANGVTVALPMAMTAGRPYALWVANPEPASPSTWAYSPAPVMLNDARTLWVSPPWHYATAQRPGLVRTFKVVGRNLQPQTSGVPTRVKLTNAANVTYVLDAASDGDPTTQLERYVAQVRLPSAVAPGTWEVQVSRDGGVTYWPGSIGALEIRADPPAPPTFTVGDPAYTGSIPGGCHADDGLDDTLCVARVLHAAGLTVDANTPRVNVVVPAGTWSMSDCRPNNWSSSQLDDSFFGAPYAACYVHWGVPVPAGVNLIAAAGPQPSLEVGQDFARPTAAYTSTSGRQTLLNLAGQNLIQGLRFHDSYHFPYTDAETGLPASMPGTITLTLSGNDVDVVNNFFDDTYQGVLTHATMPLIDGVVGTSDVVVKGNRFGSYAAGIDVGALENTIITGNTFWPGGKQDTIAAGSRGARGVEWTSNTMDGNVTTYSGLFTGWRAGLFFPNKHSSHEDLLVAGNRITCVGFRPHVDGEAITTDSNGEFVGTRSSVPVTSVQSSRLVTITPGGELAVTPDQLVGLWARVDYGPGLGQTRKITGYYQAGGDLQLVVTPPFDVVPVPGATRILIGRQTWQMIYVDNLVDNRFSTCTNTTHDLTSLPAGNAGTLGVYGSTADVTFESNKQYDTAGMSFAAQYVDFRDSSNPPPTTVQTPVFFTDIRGNLIDGSFGAAADGTPHPLNTHGSGINLFAMSGTALDQQPQASPNWVGFGVSIQRNTLNHASTTVADVYHRPIAIAIASLAQGWHQSIAPGYVDTIVAGNDLGAPAFANLSTGIANGGLASNNYPLDTTVCANKISAAFTDPIKDFPVSTSTLTQCGSGCAAGAQLVDWFAPGMVGCNKPSGATWDVRGSLCGAGFAACTADEWNSYRGSVAPTSNYWTDDNLQYLGTATACQAVKSGGNSCGANRPMRVCAASADGFGNTCTWTGCGLATTQNQYLGGCTANPTAGTLCCQRGLGCANNKVPDDFFAPKMVGCGGAVGWDARAQLCGPGYHVCAAAEWNARRGSAVPTGDYWTNDNLQYAGVANACQAVYSGGTSCGVNRPMRICTGGADKYGNTCTWTGCGLATAQNQYFGGCVANPTAGTACCAD